jgi:hypothetical protein
VTSIPFISATRLMSIRSEGWANRNLLISQHNT